jgi:hypothetical protein
MNKNPLFTEAQIAVEALAAKLAAAAEVQKVI